VGQPGQPLRSRQLLVAQRADPPPRVPQPGLGQVVGALQGGADPSAVRLLGRRQQPGPLQLQGERRQRMGQHVVHLAGQVLALGEGGRLHLGGPGLLELIQEPLGAPLALPCPLGEHHHQVQGAQADRGQDDAHDRAVGGGRADHGQAQDQSQTGRGGAGPGGHAQRRQPGGQEEEPEEAGPGRLQPHQHPRPGDQGAQERHLHPHRRVAQQRSRAPSRPTAKAARASSTPSRSPCSPGAGCSAGPSMITAATITTPTGRSQRSRVVRELTRPL
jgi:hypothetical protein